MGYMMTTQRYRDNTAHTTFLVSCVCKKSTLTFVPAAYSIGIRRKIPKVTCSRYPGKLGGNMYFRAKAIFTEVVLRC